MNAGEYFDVTVPALPAASLVVIDDRPDLHVLLGRRRPGAFVGDMIVYPGGAVDDNDWRLGPTLVPGAGAGLCYRCGGVLTPRSARRARRSACSPTRTRCMTARRSLRWATGRPRGGASLRHHFFSLATPVAAQVADDELVEVWWGAAGRHARSARSR